MDVVPVVLGALESVTKKLEKWSEKLVIRIGQLQKTALLGTARILRKVLKKDVIFFFQQHLVGVYFSFSSVYNISY